MQRLIQKVSKMSNHLCPYISSSIFYKSVVTPPINQEIKINTKTTFSTSAELLLCYKSFLDLANTTYILSKYWDLEKSMKRKAAFSGKL